MLKIVQEAIWKHTNKYRFLLETLAHLALVTIDREQQIIQEWVNLRKTEKYIKKKKKT